MIFSSNMGTEKGKTVFKTFHSDSEVYKMSKDTLKLYMYMYRCNISGYLCVCVLLFNRACVCLWVSVLAVHLHVLV